MSREMRFQAATVSSHSMILVILVTSSKGWRRERELRKQIARETMRINCLRRRGTTACDGVADARCGKVGREGRPVSHPGTPATSPSFFFPHHQRCLNTPAREYLVTAVSRARYRFISHYRVRATIPWACSSLSVYTSIVDTLNTLPCRCGSTCRAPSRGITINLRGINRSLLRATVGAGVRCSPWLAVARYCERDTFT